MEWISTLFSIIIIDLVLAGDNALVIGMAARNLPRAHQTKAVIWGTVGAVLIRVLATFLVVFLLEIPGLLLAGGLVLIWIAYKLLVEEEDKKELHSASPVSIWGAVRTIIIADAVMGLDNVLGIAGAAHGHFLLIVIGLSISIPIVVWGSTLIMRLIERFPFIVYIGSGVLALTAGKMLTGEEWVHDFFVEQPVLKWTVISVIIAAVLLAGKVARANQEKKASQAAL